MNEKMISYQAGKITAEIWVYYRERQMKKNKWKRKSKILIQSKFMSRVICFRASFFWYHSII